MFDERTKGAGIVFAGNLITGELIKDSIKDGDSVVLRKNGENVLVRDVAKLAGSYFKGTIYGFEPSHSLEYQGLKIDDALEFEEQNIISCFSV